MELTGLLEGRYEILSRLGTGAFGEVYRALDRRLNREVAIKRLRLEAMNDESERRQAQARFLQEARIAAQLQHPNIVTVHDVVGTSELLFMVLELVEGETLQNRIHRYSTLDPFETLAILRPAAEAIDFANRAGVVHRDVKPANIMIDHKGTVKVADFGIAKMDNTSNLTGTGHLIGTPNYMSPEQARGEVVDQRSDIFSLGCVLFECMSGRRAFEGESVTAVLLKIVGNQPERFEAAGLSMHAELLSVIDRALAHDKTDRFKTAVEMMAALEEATATTTKKSPAQVLEATIAAGRMLGQGPSFAGSTFVDTAAHSLMSPPPPPRPEAGDLPVGGSSGGRTAERSAQTSDPGTHSQQNWQRYWPLAIAAGILLVGVSVASVWLGQTLATDQKTTNADPATGGAFVVVGDPVSDRASWAERDPSTTKEQIEEPSPPAAMEDLELRRPDPTPRPQLTAKRPEHNTDHSSPNSAAEMGTSSQTSLAQTTQQEEVAAASEPEPMQSAPMGPRAEPGPGEEYKETLRVRVGVELDIEPDETEIAINGKVIGIAEDIAEDWEFERPGTYSFRFTAPGRTTQWWLVKVGQNGDKWEDLEVDLKRTRKRWRKN